MSTVTRHTLKVQRREPRVAEAARILGCTREHLSRVLNGRRPSRSLTARYEALKARQLEDQDAAGSMSAVRILAPGETPCKNSSASCTKASRVNCRLGHPTSR